MSSEHYTHGHHDSVLRSHSWRTVENSAAYLVPHLAPGLAVLDVGAGPGTITIDLAQRVAPGSVLGIDASADVVATAAASAEAAGVDNVRFEVGDAYALDLPDDAFDIVHAHQVLQHLADPVAALGEMRRVLKPGGILAVRDADYGGASWFPRLHGLGLWMETYQVLARQNQGEPDAGPELKAWVRAAGFADATETASIWCFSSDEDRAWWGGTWAERVTDSAFATQAVDAGIADLDRLGEIAAAWRAWSADDDGVFFMPHGEVIARKD
jgi:ubiquinone/menaquinone biosynthesis C-methylase UbiE